ncbi:hypothetical protein ASE21_17785 [Flavobacterium sp. Root901]|nr:hypothetical protein ASE21_17785 [Flavobacterium sp. Root901]
MNNIHAQDCPNRIGDFIINESTTDVFEKICNYCSGHYYIPISNGIDYLSHEVANEDSDYDYSLTTTIYELKPDLDNITSWYNFDYANLSDSTRVFFIPNYETDGISIKNLLLKFNNDKLFYMKASLSQSHLDIIIEKYKGKGIISETKKTKNKCKLLKFQKYMNEHSEINFLSSFDKIRAKITLDFKVNSNCRAVRDDTIEIYNFDELVVNLKSLNYNAKILIEEDKISKQKAKEEKLSRF